MKIIHKNLLILLTLLFTSTSFSQINILLRKSFIDSLKNRIIIDADYYVVKMHEHPNPPSKDGDMHIAGFSKGIGLPVVSEIMNAKFEDDAIDTLRVYEGKEQPVHIEGVWRIWCEHSGSDTQDQGTPFPTIVNTNPHHVFEIHPVTKVKNMDLIGSLHSIEGYTYKNADDAFKRYSKTACLLEDKGDKVLIRTKGVGYNYADFWIEIYDNGQFVANNGRFVLCRVKDSTGNIIYNKMSMVFPIGSEAEFKVKDLHIGDSMHVLGIPRIDLSLVSYRIKHASDKPYMLEWNLPVEMIIVAIIDQ